MKKLFFSMCLCATLNLCCMEEITNAWHDIHFGDFFTAPKPLTNKNILDQIKALEKSNKIPESKKHAQIADNYQKLMERAITSKSLEKEAEYLRLRDEHDTLAKKCELYEDINVISLQNIDPKDYSSKARKYAHLELQYGKLLEYTSDQEETVEVEEARNKASKKRIRAELMQKIETLEIENNTTELLESYEQILTTFDSAHEKCSRILDIIGKLTRQKTIADQINPLTNAIDEAERSFQPTFKNFDALARLHKQRMAVYATNKNRYQTEYSADLDTTISLLSRQATLTADQHMQQRLLNQTVELRLLKSQTK